MPLHVSWSPYVLYLSQFNVYNQSSPKNVVEETLQPLNSYQTFKISSSNHLPLPAIPIPYVVMAYMALYIVQEHKAMYLEICAHGNYYCGQELYYR